LDATSLMGANGSSACSAGPFFLFPDKQFIYPGIPDNRQVVYHTQVIFFAVSFVHMRQPFTGELQAGITKLRIQVLTVLNFAVYSCGRFVFKGFPAA